MLLGLRSGFDACDVNPRKAAASSRKPAGKAFRFVRNGLESFLLKGEEEGEEEIFSKLTQ